MACVRPSPVVATIAAGANLSGIDDGAADTTAATQSVDGSSCSSPRTLAGVAAVAGGCADLGEGSSGGRWHQLAFIPARTAPSAAATRRASALHSLLDSLQFPSTGCAQPEQLQRVDGQIQIGFGASIEHTMLSLARATERGAQLALGQGSNPTWASSWFCGAERSMRCYFNFSSCCPVAQPGAASEEATMRGRFGKPGDKRGRLAKMGKMDKMDKMGKMGKMDKMGKMGEMGEMGRGKMGKPSHDNSRAISMRGWTEFGTLFTSAQLAYYLFSRMQPRVRDMIDQRRREAGTPRAIAAATTGAPSAAAAAVGCATIGMHIRRGDSCALRSRFCPANLTATYFAAAAHLRDRHVASARGDSGSGSSGGGSVTVRLSTDDAEAAALCTRRPFGLHCTASGMERRRFESWTSIERRVARHEQGQLSGSAVALDALADIDALADSDCHVLVLRSAVSRLALALSVARKGRVPPFVSLQWPWGGMPGPTAETGRAVSFDDPLRVARGRGRCGRQRPRTSSWQTTGSRVSSSRSNM